MKKSNLLGFPHKGPEWERRLHRSKSGDHELKKVVSNVIEILTNAPEWEKCIAWDEFAQRIIITRSCPGGEPGPWNEIAEIDAAKWLQDSRWRLDVGDELVSKAAASIAARNRVHPVRDWLRSLKWDGVERIDTWLSHYLGVDDKPLSRAYGRRFLVSAVARVMRPGCQVDTMLILEGGQGLRKSTALRILASDAWFLDTSIDVRDKEAASALRQKWIVEFSELAALRGGDIERTKQFVSARVDTYREKYGRYFVDHPRQCVIVGTTNADRYLQDTTGNRRFQSVRIAKVEISDLNRDREQLWAEAVAAFDGEELWYLHEDELRLAAEQEQEERRVTDPWEEAISDYVSNPVRQKNGITTSDVLGECLRVEVRERTRACEMRTGTILCKLGWFKRRVQRASSRAYLYFPTESEAGKAVGVAPKQSTESNGSPTCPTYPTSIEEEEVDERVTKHLIGSGGAGQAVGQDEDPPEFPGSDLLE